MNRLPTVPSSRNDENTRITALLQYKQQIILQGPPGTGKTYLAKNIAELVLTNNVSPTKKEQEENLSQLSRYKLVQFHPSYTYEDFVRGIVVNTDGPTAKYEVKDKTLALFAEEARKNPTEPYVLIIDEINRANLSSVLGELIYALEYRDQAVESMYPKNGDATLVLPKKLYVIGTMNTADRSAGHIDYAIRRRFAFVNVLPKELANEDFDNERFRFDSKLFKQVKALFTTDEYETRSEHLSEEFRPQDVALGHSYFIADTNVADSMALRLEYDIKPILLEYVKDGVLKESARRKVNELSVEDPASRLPSPKRTYSQLMLDTRTLFLETTSQRYRLRDFGNFQQIYLGAPIPNNSLHYEFLWEPSLEQVTVDFHIESNDVRLAGIATLLQSIATDTSIVEGAEITLIPNWQKKRVGYRLVLSNLEQAPQTLTSAMVALMSSTIDRIRATFESSQQPSSSVTQREFF